MNFKFPVADSDFKKAKGSTRFFCVGVAITEQGVAVRNTKDESKDTVFFTHEEWRVFVSGVKNNEFEV